MSEIIEDPHISYQIMEFISDSGTLYSNLINELQIIERYGDVNALAVEIRKLIVLKIIESTKEYSQEEGDDFRLTLTERGKTILKNPHR